LGRKKSPNPRLNWVHLRMTDGERAALEHAAEAEGCPMASKARQILMAGLVEQPGGSGDPAGRSREAEKWKAI